MPLIFRQGLFQEGSSLLRSLFGKEIISVERRNVKVVKTELVFLKSHCESGGSKANWEGSRPGHGYGPRVVKFRLSMEWR
jgi:hypothetical protein